MSTNVRRLFAWHTSFASDDATTATRGPSARAIKSRGANCESKGTGERDMRGIGDPVGCGKGTEGNGF